MDEQHREEYREWVRDLGGEQFAWEYQRALLTIEEFERRMSVVEAYEGIDDDYDVDVAESLGDEFERWLRERSEG